MGAKLLSHFILVLVVAAGIAEEFNTIEVCKSDCTTMSMVNIMDCMSEDKIEDDFSNEITCYIAEQDSYDSCIKSCSKEAKEEAKEKKSKKKKSTRKTTSQKKKSNKSKF